VIATTSRSTWPLQEALRGRRASRLTREAYYARYLGFDDHRRGVSRPCARTGRGAAGARARALMAAKADRFLRLVRAGAPIFPACRPSCARGSARPARHRSGALRREIELILAQAGLADLFTRS